MYTYSCSWSLSRLEIGSSQQLQRNNQTSEPLKKIPSQKSKRLKPANLNIHLPSRRNLPIEISFPYNIKEFHQPKRLQDQFNPLPSLSNIHNTNRLFNPMGKKHVSHHTATKPMRSLTKSRSRESRHLKACSSGNLVIGAEELPGEMVFSLGG